MSVFSIFLNQPRITTPSPQAAPEITYHQLEASLGVNVSPGNGTLFELGGAFRPHPNVNLSAYIFTDWSNRIFGTLGAGGHIPLTDFMSIEINGIGGLGSLLDWQTQQGRLQEEVIFNGLTWYLGGQIRQLVHFNNSIGLSFSLTYLHEFDANVTAHPAIGPISRERIHFDNDMLILGIAITVSGHQSTEENQERNDSIHEQQSRRRIRTHEQPDNSPAGLQARLRALGIAIEGRFDPVRTRSLVENRELIERLSHESNPRFTDNRPIAVVIDPTADHNGAFNSRPEKPINVLAADSRFFTLYYQVSTETELREALTTLTRVTGRRVHTLIIAGHGQRTQLQLGNPPSASGDQDPYYLNSDEIMRGRLDYLGDVMEVSEGQSEGQLFLYSCSNGAVIDPSSSDDTSIPNVASAIPNRTGRFAVLAMNRPSNIRSFRIRDDLTMQVVPQEGWVTITHLDNRPSIPSIPPTSPSSPASR